MYTASASLLLVMFENAMHGRTCVIHGVQRVLLQAFWGAAFRRRKLALVCRNPAGAARERTYDIL